MRRWRTRLAVLASVAMLGALLPAALVGAETPSLTIMEIQGPRGFSAYEGQVVETTGVVTLYNSFGSSFWMQDPSGDGDPNTSDGILVSGGGFPDVGEAPAVGDLVRVVAEVDEQQFGNALPLTRLRSVDLIEVLSSGNALPAPVRVEGLPNAAVPPTRDFWERLEGMLVSVRSATVVSPTSRFGEFAMLVPRDAQPGSGFFFENSQILLNSPSPGRVDYNPERILVDDTSLEDAIIVRPGDTVRRMIGAVDYTFGNYKLQPLAYAVSTRPLPATPVSERSGALGDTVITSFNVQNLFDLVDNPDKDDEGSTPDPDELETQLTKLTAAIVYELGLPDIVVVQEVENTAILQELGDRVNGYAGTAYTATSFETSDGRGIEAGFLWDASRVDLLDAFQITEAIVPGTEAAFGPSSPSPGREPIVGRFDIGGHHVIIVGNHFKSKSGDDPIFGVNQPLTRPTEVQRKAQAQVVRDYIDMVFAGDPGAMLMVTGDLNDFQFSEPGEGPDNPVAIVAGIGGGVPLTNLIEFEPEHERYTFIFDGNSQVLDHMLVSPSLLAYLAGTDILHFNASYPNVLGDDPTTTLRASDHDAVEGRFWLGGS